MMLGSNCSPCCGDECKGCKSAAWGAARRFAQSLASLNGTSYTGLSIDGQVQDSVFAVQSSAAVATFEGSSVFPPVPGLGNGKNRAQASLVSDSKGCVSGRATVTVPLDGLFFGAEKGTRYYKTPFEVRVSFNRDFGTAVPLSPSIFIEQSVIGFQFWAGPISRPLITGVRFGGESVSGTLWDGVSEPTINNAIPSNSLYIFPSNNCKWRGRVAEISVLEVPVGNYGGPIEIDLTIFTRESVIDEDGDVYPAYSVLSTGTVTVQWDDMTEFEVDEDCNLGACCNGTTCSVKPQCQCNAAAGEVFKGVGTVCSPNPCVSRCCGPESVTFSCGGVAVTYVPCFNGLSESECTQKGDGWVWEQGVSCDYILSRASFSLNCLEQGVPFFECLGDCPPYSSTNPSDCCYPCNTGGIVVDVCPDGCGCNYDTGRCVKNPLP